MKKEKQENKENAENKTESKEITFKDLGLNTNTLEAVRKKGFDKPSEIQAKIIPHVLEDKNDIIGVSKTGSGKTASFGLPIIDKISEMSSLPQVIILAPTRELALQVTAELETYKGNKKLKLLTVYGGTSINTQIKDLKKGVDIVVGTPGRVLDLIDRKTLNLSEIKYFVLDEADEMLKMGFIEDIELIFQQTPKQRKVLLFSATMPDKIKKLSQKYMKNQIVIEIKNIEENKLDIHQQFFILKREEKFPALTKIIDMENFFYGIVFCMTKADVDEVTKNLQRAGYDADCIHGDIMQSKRERILKKFRDLKINILVATDVAARGIDVSNLTHVINYALPKETESYVHRIGRTGRAGKKGTAISFVSPKQTFMLREIEKITKIRIEKAILPNDKEVQLKRAENSKKEITELIETNQDIKYLDTATELINQFGAESTICALLSKLDKKDSNQSSKSSGNEKKVRIFIAKGKESGFDKKSLFRLLEKEARTSIDGESVKINGKFSFMTVPQTQAEKILDAFDKGRGRPLVELASER